MRILLDTNIVINRETSPSPNYSIGHLYHWISKLKYDILIHQYTVEEILKYSTDTNQSLLQTKIDAYEVLASVIEPSAEFLNKLPLPSRGSNDDIDNCLIFEVYNNRVDLLITEDRQMIYKANVLGIQDRVLTINQFITRVTNENPTLIKYDVLSVTKVKFADVNHADTFFDNFRDNYDGFDNWFLRKSNEDAYICKDSSGTMLGFLYLKLEDESEPYHDMEPLFQPQRRLKIGTFKVESTGFRLGERFIKIIFDNAIQLKVKEIYVTMFEEQKELIALRDLLRRWGFIDYGIKNTRNGKEIVLLKHLNKYDPHKTPKENYPNVLYTKKKLFMPIMPEYHTKLFPDSILKTEESGDFIDQIAYRYALQKVYISWTTVANNAQPGDLVLFYRMGDEGTNKKYSSVVSTIGVVESIISHFDNREDFLSHCQNRSVFTLDDLNSFWNNEWRQRNMKVMKFLFVKNLKKRPTLEVLWEEEIIPPPNGPRQFTEMSDVHFNLLLERSETTYELFYE